MPAPKTKSAAPSNGTANKSKASSRSGTATPVSSAPAKETSEQLATLGGGKPDKAAYDADQDRIKKEIDALQTKLNAVRDKIALATQSSTGNERRTALRAELDSLREQQGAGKNSRVKVHEQIKILKDGVVKKGKDLQAAKAKIPFKTIAETEAHIKNLEKQIESGNLKLAEEKRAIQDISTSKKNRRLLESFQAEQDSIDADKVQIAELEKQRDDPVARALSDRYTAIKEELDQLKKEGDEAYAGRSKLFQERDTIQDQLKTLFNEKRESAQRYRDANDRHWAKIHEDRARRQEREKARRDAEHAERKREQAERLLEEAKVPAFQAQIEDCQTLIDFFSGKTSGNVTFKSTSTPLIQRAEVTSVPKLELRKVEEAPEGVIVRKKKGEDQEAYYVGGKKNKNKKGPKPAASPVQESASPAPAAAASGSLQVPLPTLVALTSLSIPPPSSNDDLPRLIEDLTTKKLWYEANQARETAENIAKAEAEIQRLDKLDGVSTPVSEGAEVPPEPVPTPADAPAPVVAVSSEAVDSKLEAVQEDAAP